MKKTLTALVGTGILLVSSAALAQQGPPPQQGGQYGWSGSYQGGPPPSTQSLDNIGEEAQLTFGVDRIMGVSYDKVTLSTDPEDTVSKTTTIALFGQSGRSSMIPRLALDYFVVESVSIGGSLVFWHQSSTIDTAGGSGDGPKTTDFLINPRVGYAYAFDETFSIWPRLGVTYFSHKVTQTDPISGNDSDTTDSGLDITAEVPIGISPFENFAILLGPYLEFPLTGTHSQTGADDIDEKLLSFGLFTSILGYY